MTHIVLILLFLHFYFCFCSDDNVRLSKMRYALDEVENYRNVLLTTDEFQARHDVFDMSGCIYFPKYSFIGAQKAATTTVYVWLDQCLPQLCYSHKELHLFDNTLLVDVASAEHLCSVYKRAWVKNARRDCIAVESTPSNAISRIAAKVYSHSGTRLVFIVRDPVDRLVSSLNMAIGRTNRCKLESNVNDTKIQLLNAIRGRRKDAAMDSHWKTFFYGQDRMKKSLYDLTFSMYSGANLFVLTFEDIVRSCSVDLIERAMGFNFTESQRTCILNKCKSGEKYNSAPPQRRCYEVSVEDIPTEVVAYIRKYNTIYYDQFASNFTEE